ncbi:glycosyl hydrolase [Actinomadura sp. WMMA1423]|uniref:glycosyl hydrolase n=1 Tax=Actinomadura sp. WMMA1423 TaxID=2591108 RepID=UPI0011476915|nr:glycosyl hydrolase [Actinomadura sp. WMMA1423]
MSPTPRRRLQAGVMALACTAALSAAPTAASAASAAPFGVSFARGFASPPTDARPKIRYWWPCGEITPAAIEAEVRQIASRGFSAAEISCMFSSNPGEYGWGSSALTDRLEKAVQAGRRHGVNIDFTVGPSWPLVVPGLTPDSPGAAQEIAYGSTVVEGGTSHTGPVPAAPAPHAGVEKQTLVAVQAVRCAVACTGAKPVKLDRSSLIDLTGRVRNGSVSWTAPADGEWLLLAYWWRGTGQASVAGQAVSGRPAFVVDHFSTAGAKAATNYWDQHILTPAMRRLLNGGNLFEDSLELDSGQHWTADLPARFRVLRGYSLRDNLPVLFIDKIHRQYTAVTPDDTPDFEFTDGSGARVRDDYYRTLTDLYIAEHVKPLQTWAHARGLRFRAQPYGTTIDTPSVDAALDVPETESLGMWAGYDDEPSRWTSSGAVHLAGREVFSLECCATYGEAYGQTWPEMLKHFNTAFAHGVNQVVYHGFPTEQGFGAQWPGFSPFTTQGGNGFSEAWGPRQPTWDDTRKISDWTARTQYVLRQGSPRVDLAVYRQSYGTKVREPAGASGFTYDFTGPGQLDGTRVENRRLAPGGPAYRALVLGRQQTLPVGTARLLLAHARQGLPIVIVGDPPSRTPGAYEATAQDAELGRTVKALLAQPSVRHIAAQGDLADTLADLGVRASAEPTAPGLLNVRRARPGGDLYYLYNPTSAAISTQLSLEGRGGPYELDAWTGKITAIGRYRTEGPRTTVPVSLAPGASTIIALGKPGGRHATATTGGEIVTEGRALALRASEAGPYTVSLDNGRTVRVTVPEADALRTLNSWTLSVDDWHRGADGKRETTRHQLDLARLTPWSDIPELQDVSGVGTYSTTVTLARLDGAYLDLGEVTDTFEVTVNGRALPPADQVTGRLDLTGYVHEGANTITVKVATPLRNRLRVTDGFPGQAQQPRQRYGLIGPVRLTPYRQVPVSR